MMINKVGDRLRTLMNDALVSTRGNQYRPVKMLREVLGTANDLVGRPLCSEAELRDVTINGELPPSAFAPPRRAQRLP